MASSRRRFVLYDSKSTLCILLLFDSAVKPVLNLEKKLALKLISLDLSTNKNPGGKRNENTQF